MNFHGSFGDEGTIRARQLFLKWSNIAKVLDLSVGRVPLFAGVGIGMVDGATARLRLYENRLSILGYGGANVSPLLKSKGFADLDKNYLAGGQITGNVAEGLKLGVSYVNRNVQRDSYTAIRPDSAYNPIAVTIVPEHKAEQIAGADVRYTYADLVTSYGRFDYDINAKRSLRGQLYARVAATGQIAFTGEFIYREPRIYYNSIFSVFPVSPSREVEGGVEYSFNSSVRAYGKLGYVRYTDVVSRRLSFGLYTEYASAGFSGANGYAGQLSSFDLQAMYPLLDRSVIPTIGFSYGTYRQNAELDARQEIYSGSLGGVFRPLPQFSLDAQVQWLRTPIAKSDVRLFAKINYWFHTNLNLFADGSR
jgi:hypothetical protein